MNGAEAAFGEFAPAYDGVFTHSQTGMLQRRRIWKFLHKNFSSAEFPNVLELNCGTGEDAIWFTKKGYRVTATDISAGMLEVAGKKSAGENVDIKWVHTDAQTAHALLQDKKFDLVFSNFGGMNCISPNELLRLGNDLPALLNPGGKFVAVVMGRNCRWEQFYFNRKKNTEQAYRRRSKDAVPVMLNDNTFPVWYYSPDEFGSFFSDQFIVKKIRPVGIALPPSYLEKYFTEKNFMLAMLNSAERLLSNFSSLADKADHYVIELEKKKQ